MNNSFKINYAPTAWRLRGAVVVHALLTIVMAFAGAQTARAGDINLSEDTGETAGTAARWYVKMPASGTSTLTLTTQDIAADKGTFKVYDSGGKGDSAGRSRNGTLVINAPTGYRLLLQGNFITTTTTNDNNLKVYNGAEATGDPIVDLKGKNSTISINAESTGQSITINLTTTKSVMALGEPNLDLTVMLVDPHVNITQQTTGGTLASDKAVAATGELVTLTATPADGYVLESITAVDGLGQPVDVTGGLWYTYNNTDKATFYMPPSGVTVTPTFTNKLTADDGHYINMPASGTLNAYIQEGVVSFKVYDDGGKDGNYSTSCDGTLIITAPQGYIVQLSGTVNISNSIGTVESTADPKFTIYDSDGSKITSIWDYHGYVNRNIGTINSTGNVMTLHMYSNSYYTRSGLDLTVKIIEPAAKYDVLLADGISHGSIVADPIRAEGGTTVSLTASPDDGYLLNGISVKDVNNNAVSVSYQPWYKGVNTASFEMPLADVTVAPTFTKIDNTANEFAVCIPKTGEDAGTIPDGVVSFKVYDWAGPNGKYGPNCNGRVTLTAPTGYGFMVEGNYQLWGNKYSPSLTITNGTETVLTLRGTTDERYHELSPFISADGTLTFEFVSDNQGFHYLAGLDLTVTLVDITTAYAITVVGGHGHITASASEATAGTTVTLTVSDDSGYQIATTPTVTDASAQAVAVNDLGNGTYSFQMPPSAVTVTVLSVEPGWVLTGTYATQQFTAADANIYGFAGTAGTGVDVGTFVRVGGYVRVKPMRAYLTAPSASAARQLTRAAGQADAPQSMKVRLIGSNGEETGISLTPDPSPKGEGNDYWYSLDGRRIANGQKPKAKGLYIYKGKKVVIK